MLAARGWAMHVSDLMNLDAGLAYRRIEQYPCPIAELAARPITAGKTGGSHCCFALNKPS
jgi:hypothetical protein